MSEGKFVRVVNRKGVIALAFGAMVGWSWVALSGNWIASAGSVGAMLVFVVEQLASARGNRKGEVAECDLRAGLQRFADDRLALPRGAFHEGGRAFVDLGIHGVHACAPACADAKGRCYATSGVKRYPVP